MPPPRSKAAAFWVEANFVLVTPGVSVTPRIPGRGVGSRALGIKKLLELWTPPPKNSKKGETTPALFT
jgi:hypothetical protein